MSIVSLTQPPLFLQERQYSARITRLITTLIGTQGVVGDGFEVSERGAGANMSVDVAAGRVLVQGDDQANQGQYLVVSESIVNVAVETADPTNPRIDLVIVRVRDTNAGAPSGDDGVIEVVEGTPGATPEEPDVPGSAVLLATILVPAAAVSVQDNDITDRREFSVSVLNSTFRFVTYASDTVEVNLSSSSAGVRVATGDLIFSAVNVTEGQFANLRVDAGASARSLTWPADWKFVSFKPTTLAANKVGVLGLSAFGDQQSDIVAAWSAEG